MVVMNKTKMGGLLYEKINTDFIMYTTIAGSFFYIHIFGKRNNK